MSTEQDFSHSAESDFHFFSKKRRARVHLYRAFMGERLAQNHREERPLCEGEIPCTRYGSDDALAKRAVLSVFSLLPSEVRREIEEITGRNSHTLSELEEIRMSRNGLSSLCFSGREVPLRVGVTSDVLHACVKAICRGAPFSHREEMAEGYLPFEEGVRVGICGIRHYTRQEEISAIREVHTLVFRIPHTPYSGDTVSALAETIRRHSRRGCLIVSAPRVGKTTALRMLCRAFATGTGAMRVAVVDTRGEFTEYDSKGALMDILSGYSREEGALIALRTLSPQVLAMDEIGGAGDTRALCDLTRAGVWLLATAHAVDMEDVRARPVLSEILRLGVLDTALFLGRREGRIAYRLMSL